MIYRLQDGYIDLNKLEFVSDIKEYPMAMIFEFQINGCCYKCDCIRNRKEIESVRDDLVDRWKKWQREGV